jgi:hypothetical protein
MYQIQQCVDVLSTLFLGGRKQSRVGHCVMPSMEGSHTYGPTWISHGRGDWQDSPEMSG